MVGDTSPQLGGTLDTNGNNIEFGDNERALFGDSNDLRVYHNSHSYIDHVTASNLHIRNTFTDQDVTIQTDDGSGNLATYFQAEGASGEASLHYYGAKKLATKSGGVTVTGTLTATAFSGDGSALIITSSVPHLIKFLRVILK